MILVKEVFIIFSSIFLFCLKRLALFLKVLLGIRGTLYTKVELEMNFCCLTLSGWSVPDFNFKINFLLGQKEQKIRMESILVLGDSNCCTGNSKVSLTYFEQSFNIFNFVKLYM